MEEKWEPVDPEAGPWGVLKENDIWYAVRRETRVYSPSDEREDAAKLARWFYENEELRKGARRR